MNILVTGGAGYIGRFCVRALVRAHHVPIVLDRHQWKGQVAGGMLAVVGDVADGPLVAAMLREHRIEAVFHLAADKSVSASMANPGPHFQNNVCGTLSLLQTMHQAGVHRIVFSSSAAVYGSPLSLPVTEASPLRPENPYGASKMMAEEMLRWFHSSHNLDSISLRYFNAAGAAADGSLGEDAPDAVNLIPRVMKALNSGQPLEVYGGDFPTPDGTAIRDYVHVADLAEAHVAALEFLGRHSGSHAFNLGTGRGVSVREIIDAAAAASGRAVPHVLVDRRPGDPAAVWAETTKARDALGWRAHRALSEIVRSAWVFQCRARMGGSPGARPAIPE